VSVMGSLLKRLTLSIVLIALGVVLAPLYFIAGPTKAFPFQHMINAISGVFLGPWYAMVIAITIGAIRNGLGTGTIFAFPGGIPGALVVGLLYHYVKKTDYMALSEFLGTTLGALISAIIIAPFIGVKMPPLLGIEVQWALFTIYWLISSVPGCTLGFLVIKVLRRTGVAEALLPGEASR